MMNTKTHHNEQTAVQVRSGIRAGGINLPDDSEQTAVQVSSGVRAGGAVIGRPVPTRARWVPLLAAVAAGLAAVGVGAALTALADDPAPMVVPTPAVAAPADQLTVAEEVALLHASTARTHPTDQLTFTDQQLTDALSLFYGA